MRHRRAFCLATLLSLCAATPVSAQPASAGPETALADSSSLSFAVAGHPGGGFTLVWRTNGNRSPGPFRARRFAAGGTPLTGEIAVGTGDTPGITAVGQGFIVFGLQGGLALRFDASGRPVGTPFPVTGSKAAADAQGNFATAAVTATGVSLFRFSASGEPRGVTAVPISPVQDRFNATVARAPHGEMLVAWQSGEYGQVHGQRFDRFGDRVGGIFQVGGGTPANPPVVSAAADGSFLVAWLGWAVEDVDPPDPSYGVWVRLYSSAGIAVGEAFRIGEGVGEETFEQVALAPAPAGSFFAVWAGRQDVHVRQIYADGSLSPEAATRRGRLPATAPVAAASWGDGDLAVAWTRRSDLSGVAIQRFATDASPGALRFALGRYVGVLGGGALPVQVERREGTLGEVSATYTLRGPSVPAVSGTVTFAAGDSTPKAFSLSLPAVLPSGEETWLLALSEPTGGATLASPGRAWIEVRDGAAPSPLLAGDGAVFVPQPPADIVYWSAVPSVAVLTDSGFVTTWEAHDDYDLTSPLLGQTLFGPDGSERSRSLFPEFRGRACQVAAHPRGGFTMTCRFDTCGACGQHFDNQGRLVGDAFDLVFTPDSLAAGRAGGLLSLAGGGYQSFVAAYDPQGRGLGPPRRINETLGRALDLPPALATGSLGRGVVIWRAPSLNGDQVLARRVGAAGQPLGAELRVDQATGRFPDRPAVDLAPDGRFVVAWEDDDGDGSGIWARRFDAAGVPAGAPFPVNSRTAGNQDFPHVALQGDGRFLILWRGPGEEGARSLYAQYFSAAGARLGAEIRVDPSPADVTDAALAANAAGRYVAFWIRSGQTVAGRWWTAPP